MFVTCEMKQKNMFSCSGNAVREAFLLRRFFFLSLTHAPIFHRSMQMLWMQRNILCNAAATFKMIVMSLARSPSVLSAVKPKQRDLLDAIVLVLGSFHHASPM